MSARDHSLYQEEVGAYLLGALTGLEDQAFERHMTHCPTCRDEVERLRPAADALPRAVEQITPPPSLKTALMEVVDQEAEQLAAESPRPARRPRRRWFGSLVPSMRPVLAVGAVVLALAAGFGAAQLLDTGDETRTLTAQVDEERVPEASARLVVEGNGDNGAILRVQGMPSLDSNQVYQAWVARDKTFIPQPTFEVGDTGGGAVAIPDDLTGADQILVTREPRGGARAPGEVPILSVGL